MRFRTLGPVTVEHEEREITLQGPKQRALLAVLLSRSNSAVPADLLIETLWGPVPPRSANAMLRWHVHKLRRTLLDGSRIVRSLSGYTLVVRPGEVDADQFEALYSRGRKLFDEGDLVRSCAFFDEGLGLWRGRAYSDLDIGLLRDEAARLEELRLSAFEHQAEADLGLGRNDAAVARLRPLVAEHPWRERFRAQLMLALYRWGRQAEALRVYRDGRWLLAEELGLDPGPELRRLESAILANDPALGPAAPSAPEVPTELPRDVSGFAGRTAEVDRLVVLLGVPGNVAAIYGLAGAGKSALAVHVGHRLSGRYPDGQLYVDLHGSNPGGDPLASEEVLGRLLRSLNGRAVQADVEELAAAYRSVTAGRRLLVVLDNADNAAQMGPLLPGSPSCAVLVTSRRMLTPLDGATHIRLGPLPKDEALEMLARSVGDRRTSDQSAAAYEVVDLCDRLPLALSVAASRLVARPRWSTEQIVVRLRDPRRRLDELVDGERTVRASFLASYHDLLRDPVEAQAARMFRLTCLLDVADISVPVAAAVAGLSHPDAEALLETLVDAQLMDSEAPGRYRTHDLVRLFGRERAIEEEPGEARTAALRRALATARTRAAT